jgi:hypothetical protein
VPNCCALLSACLFCSMMKSCAHGCVSTRHHFSLRYTPHIPTWLTARSTSTSTFPTMLSIVGQTTVHPHLAQFLCVIRSTQSCISPRFRVGRRGSDRSGRYIFECTEHLSMWKHKLWSHFSQVRTHEVSVLAASHRGPIHCHKKPDKYDYDMTSKLKFVTTSQIILIPPSISI